MKDYVAQVMSCALVVHTQYTICIPVDITPNSPLVNITRRGPVR